MKMIALFASMLTVLIVSMLQFHLEPHIPLLICLFMMGVFCLSEGSSWESLEKGIIDGVAKGLQPILIMALIGVLIAAWMASGSVPYLIYWGLEWINPTWFLPCVLLLTILVSSFTGSSFATVGTVGAAMMGIGMSFGMNPALVAAAVICGACFGDKMSPLSDTTNFASAIAGVDLYTHIRHMMHTTLPAIIVTFIFFTFMGYNSNPHPIEEVSQLQAAIAQHFNLSPLTLLAPLVVTIGAIKRFPIIPLLAFGIIVAGVTTLSMQSGHDIASLLKAYHHGFHLTTDHEVLANMVNRGGLNSMLSSIILIMIALGLGGMAVQSGLLDRMMRGVIANVTSKGRAVASTALSSAGVNVFTGEMYLSILLPGQMFKPVYEKQNIGLKHLSRTLEDAGTLITPLIPWGVSGVFFAQTLGVEVLAYLPYVVFLYLCPVFSILLGYLQKERGA